MAAAERENSQLWQAQRQALDLCVRGVAVLDANRRALYLNRTARVILGRDQVLVISRGVLSSRFPEVTSALTEAVRHACAGERSAANGYFTLKRTNSQRPLILRVRPLVEASRDPDNANVCLLFMADPDLRLQPDAEVLSKAFQLTRTEAEMAILLAQGLDVEAICVRLSFGLNTARTHLKRVFDKTHTRRQAELVRLILMSSLSEEIIGTHPFG